MTEADDRVEQAYLDPKLPPSHRRFIKDDYGHEVVDSVACWCPIGKNHDKIEVPA